MDPVFHLQVFGVSLTDTAVVSAALTLVLALIAWLSTRRLDPLRVGVWQTVLETLTGWIERMIAEVFEEDPRPYVPLVGTLIIFIAAANLLAIVPVVRPPTADLSTTVALALVVFLAVPAYGIRRHGVWGYLRGYVRPHPLMLPFNLISELTRTLALAIRLFGNVMSAQMVGAVVLVFAGAFVPIPLMVLGLITGAIQAYIFGVLATVFIAAAVAVERRDHAPGSDSQLQPQESSK